MARPLRIEFPGAIYHVTSRGDRREPIFDDDTDRLVFLDIVGAALERFDACLLAYCLMGNHYHLVVHTRQGQLSRLMRHINGVYTQTYNRQHGKSGHLFQGRFKAILVDGNAYLLEVCRYVDLNPVRARMVRHPSNWKWSSYAAHTGHEVAPAWLDTNAVHGYLLGHDVRRLRDKALAAARYDVLVAQGKDVKLWDSALRQQIYLGDEAFVARMQDLAEPSKMTSLAVPRVQRQRKAKPLEGYFRKNSNRDEAIALAYREGRYPMTAIAREVGLSVSRVSKIIAQIEFEEKVET
jgi:putative transposase